MQQATPSKTRSTGPVGPAHKTSVTPREVPPARVVELFAGVGGFHLGLSASGWEVVWANQWEPSTKRVQHAFEVYRHRFPQMDDPRKLSKSDIATVSAGELPDYELLVGGFPCQDYSVAKPLPQATGIRGRKGILWWEIYRLVRETLPPMVLLENVDRLLNSPAPHRGRDFAIILACFDAMGYCVEWRVVNAEDYGFPQRRRRVFIYAWKGHQFSPREAWRQLFVTGALARALPVEQSRELPLTSSLALPRHDPYPDMSERLEFDTAVNEIAYRIGQWPELTSARSPFRSGGVMSEGQVWTQQVRARRGKSVNRTPGDHARPRLLGQVVRKTRSIPVSYLVPSEQHCLWEKHKGAKSTARSRGYSYSEGGMSCPDDRSRGSRTVITSEGGATPSRFKHIVAVDKKDKLSVVIREDGSRTPYGQFIRSHKAEYVNPDDRQIWRRLSPRELEELNGFPRGWTDVQLNGNGRISDTRRAFLMGNALVVGVVQAIGERLLKDWRG